jgi:ribonucleotide reductase alpha subunit
LDRYSVKDKRQKPFETPQYFFMRVAMGLAYNEKDPTEWAIKFYEKMSSTNTSPEDQPTLMPELLPMRFPTVSCSKSMTT